MIIGFISSTKMAYLLISQELSRKTLQQLFTYQYTKSFSRQLPFVTKSILMFGIALTQVHLIWPCSRPWSSKLHEDYVVSFLTSAAVIIPSFCHIKHTTQLAVICKVADSVLKSIVINKDIKISAL